MAERGRILLIDDEDIVCERLQAALQREGFAVEAERGCRAAYARLAETRYDLVITDVKMPGCDGLSLLELVKEQSPATQVIIISGFATAATAERALKSGAVAFVAKPFKISELRQLVLQTLAATKNRPPAG